MRRRQVLALTGTGLATPVAGCIGLFEEDVKAPLELLAWNHSHRKSTLQLYILDGDEILFADSTEIDEQSSARFDLVEETSESDEFLLIIHETGLDESSARVFECVCPDTMADQENLRYVLQVEVKTDDTLYIAGNASCG